MISDILNRRVFLSGLSGVTFLTLTTGLPVKAFALTKGEAEKLISNLSNDIERAINSSGSDATRQSAFNQIFGKYAAVGAIARSTLGPAWRGANDRQRKAYTTAFRGYLARKYSKRFTEFKGAQITITNAKSVKSGVLVNSRVTLKDNSSYNVDWQVFGRGGRSRMFDVYIEGISMIKSEREEIGILLDKSGGNIDKLITRLKTAK